MHLESSKLLVDEFARLVLPFGTTAVVADPHEIANVLGTDGVHWLLDATAGLPLDVYFMASSCVPASQLRVAAARADARRPRRAAAAAPRDRARRDDELPRRHLRRPDASSRSSRSREHVDGHAPGVLGRDAATPTPPPASAPTTRRTPPRRDASGCAPGMWLLIREALGGAQPAGAAAAARRVRAAPDRVLHRRPRAGAHRRRRPHQLDGARRGRVRDPARGRARLRDAQPRALARPRRTSARSRPATRPTCSCCPTSSGSCPRRRAEARARRSPRSRAREVPDWVRHTVRDRRARPGDVPHPVERRRRRA